MIGRRGFPLKSRNIFHLISNAGYIIFFNRCFFNTRFAKIKLPQIGFKPGRNTKLNDLFYRRNGVVKIKRGQVFNIPEIILVGISKALLLFLPAEILQNKILNHCEKYHPAGRNRKVFGPLFLFLSY